MACKLIRSTRQVHDACNLPVDFCGLQQGREGSGETCREDGRIADQTRPAEPGGVGGLVGDTTRLGVVHVERPQQVVTQIRCEAVGQGGPEQASSFVRVRIGQTGLVGERRPVVF